MADTVVDVFWSAAGHDLLAGRLYAHRRRGAESATFIYAPEWLAGRAAFELDPALPLTSAALQTRVGQELFGVFTDCAPDRWGRRLLVRAEQRCAARDRGAPRSFGEVELLLGVRDDVRQGALRFRHAEGRDFVADEQTGVPHLVDLTRLLDAAARLESHAADDSDLAEMIEVLAAEPTRELHELWRRIGFSILISNTDDHLRNHGFLRKDNSWNLSPAFDLNPDPLNAGHLSTAIDEHDTSASIELLLRVAGWFRLDARAARSILGEVESASGRWREMARRTGIAAPEIERMAPAFEHGQREIARRLAG